MLIYNKIHNNYMNRAAVSTPRQCLNVGGIIY